MPDSESVRTVRSPDGATIAFRTSGSGRPLLLVHGALRDRASWGAALPHLEREFTVYAMDRRGRGDSAPPAPASVDDHGADVVCVLEAIGQPAMLAGHSLGAHIALAAARGSSLVERLALYEPNPMLPRDAQHMRQLHEAIGAGDVERFLRVFFRLSDERYERSRVRPEWESYRRLAAATLHDRQAFEDYDLDAREYATLAIPVLVLAGEKSSEFELQPVRELADALPDVRTTVLPGTGHFGPETAPKLFAEALVRFTREPVHQAPS
jgi:pimeloyl-ACP methyl ester carboxylesterase